MSERPPAAPGLALRPGRRIRPADSLCEGCGRTLDEIAVWSRLDEDGREAVWQRLAAEGWPSQRQRPGLTRRRGCPLSAA